jgi:Ca2+/Na+ antiporter
MSMADLFPEVGSDNNWMQVTVQTGLYGYVLFVAANMIGDSAELLLLVPELTAIVGSILLPILGAVPDGMMVFCSGLGPGAQEQVKVGVGALAGSTIMLLTIPWLLSVNSGRVTILRGGKLNYHPGKDKAKLEEGGSLLTGSGVKIEKTIKDNAKIMLLTCSSYLIIQIPAFTVDSNDGFVLKQKHGAIMARELPAAWLALVTSVGFFFWYIFKMYKAGSSASGTVDDLYIKQAVKRIERNEISLRAAIDYMRTREASTQGQLTEKMIDDRATIQLKKMLSPFFRHYDRNDDKKISQFEFQSLMHDLNEDLPEKVAQKLFDQADKDKSKSMEFDEFVNLMVHFSSSKSPIQIAKPRERAKTTGFYAGAADVEGGDDEAEGGEEEDLPEDLANLSPEEQQKALKKRASVGMLIGTVLVLFFSDPMCDMLATIAEKASISPFIVSFVLAPLASNAAELVSSMKIAAKKTPSAMTQALSTLEGAAIMNNTFCLAIFMILIVWRNLEWQFSAETCSILLIQVLIAAVVLKFETQTMAHGLLIMACYPVALLVVEVLGGAGLGWD